MDKTFIMFGSDHLWVILIHIIVGTGMIIAARRTKENPRTVWIDTSVKWSIIIVLWGLFIAMRLYRMWDGSFALNKHLPLHLCGFSSALIPLLLIRPNPGLYQLMWYWGIGGATQSLLTPTVQEGFPNFYFFEFFMTHSFIIIGVVYAMVNFGYRPTIKGMFRTYAVTVLLLVPVGLINKWLGSNYLFVAHKPESASLLDFMGPWPWYLLPLSLVALIIFYLSYVPFPLTKRFRLRVRP